MSSQISGSKRSFIAVAAILVLTIVVVNVARLRHSTNDEHWSTFSVVPKGGEPVTVLAFHQSAAPLGETDLSALSVLRTHSGPLLDQLLNCLHPNVATSFLHNISALGGEAVRQRTALRFDKCFRREGAKFMYFGNNWGRHFNQMTSLVAALVLSSMLDRTLVVPPFLVDGRRVHVFELYDARLLFDTAVSPFCVVTEEEFLQLESDRLRKVGAASSGGTTAVDVSAACITMRGIKAHPQLPIGIRLNCTSIPFVKFKKELSLFFEVAGKVTSRFLTVPLVIYYAQALPEEVVMCPWRLLRPHPSIAAAVSLLRSPSQQRGEAKSISVGIHLRSLEGSCQSRQKQYQSKGLDGNAIVQQCIMSPAYVMSVVKRSMEMLMSGNSSFALESRVSYIITDDNQQPEKAKGLTASLLGAVRMLDVISLRATVDASPIALYLQKLQKGKADEANGRQLTAPYDLSSQFHRFPSTISLQMDFWALAQSDIFIGNQVSTLSMNVCRYRRANGLRCDNFV